MSQRSIKRLCGPYWGIKTHAHPAGGAHMHVGICRIGFCKTVQHLLQKSLLAIPASNKQTSGSPLQPLFRFSWHRAIGMPWKHEETQGNPPRNLAGSPCWQHNFPGQQCVVIHCSTKWSSAYTNHPYNTHRVKPALPRKN